MTTSERRLQKIDIPSYSLKQEKFNSVSHFIGVPLGIAINVVSLILFFAKNLPLSFFVGLLIFGSSVIALYLVSGLYHGEQSTNEKAKKIKRVLDHCTIYVLIAGTYTPICIYIGQMHVIGYVVLGIEWFMAAIGIIINYIDFKNKCVQAMSMFLYLCLGWLILFSGAFIYLSRYAFIYILLGGISYTVGSILYGIGHKNLYFHSVFHVFVLLGTVLQTIGVLNLFI